LPWTSKVLFHIIEPGFHDLGMTNRNIDSQAQVLAIPRFALMCWDIGSQDGHPEPFCTQETFQPRDDVMLCRVDGVNLAFATAYELGFDFADQRVFFRIRLVFVQVHRLGDDEALAALGLRIEL
jgi:hypothetical protein